MKNILFIAYQFPPFGGSHSTRTLAIANELAKENNVYVITVKLSNKFEIYDAKLEKKIDNRIRKINLDLGVLHKKYYDKKHKDELNRNIDNNKNLKKYLFSKLKKYKEYVLIPDPVIDWFWVVKKYINKEIDNIKPDIVLSSATPYTCHLIGYYISKKYNKPLILDYGDPWVYEKSRKRGKLRFGIEKTIEARILEHSKKVYITTETTKELYIDKYKIEKEKLCVMPMGYYEDDFEGNNANDNNNSKINMIYGGTLNPIHRNPIPFFEAISELDASISNDFNIEIYCNDTSYEQILKTMGISNVIKFKETVNHNEFMKKLKNFNVLLLFGNSTTVQVPGKIFNYIGSLSKIYLINNMSNYKEDATFNIIQESGDNIFSTNEKNDIKLALESIHDMWDNGKLGKNSKEKAKKYIWENAITPIKNYMSDM